MLIRVCYDVILGLTTPHWPWTCMNELLVTAHKGLTQWDLPGPELPNVRTAQPGSVTTHSLRESDAGASVCFSPWSAILFLVFHATARSREI